MRAARPSVRIIASSISSQDALLRGGSVTSHQALLLTHQGRRQHRSDGIGLALKAGAAAASASVLAFTASQPSKCSTAPPPIDAETCSASSAVPVPNARRQRLRVVLDMDECLIHSSHFSDTRGMSGFYRQVEACRASATPSTGAAPETSFRLFIDGGVSCLVHKRPGLDAFLVACAKEFETFVFTAGTKAYADPLLDRLDPEKQLFSGRFFRTECRPVTMSNGQVQYLKDLTAIEGTNDGFERTVLVDNNLVSFVCQPRNGILVPDFLGQTDDRTLADVLELLRELANLPDVRPHLDELFKLEARLANARKHLLGIEPPGDLYKVKCRL